MNDTLKAAVSKAAEHRFPSEVSGVEMNPLATQGMRGAFTEGAQALYSLLTQSQGVGLFNAKACADAAKKSADEFAGMPGGKRKALNHAFFNGATWQFDRDQAKLAALQQTNKDLHHEMHMQMASITRLGAECERLKSQDLTHAVLVSDMKLKDENERLRRALEEIAHTPIELAQYSIRDAQFTAREALGQGGE